MLEDIAHDHIPGSKDSGYHRHCYPVLMQRPYHPPEMQYLPQEIGIGTSSPLYSEDPQFMDITHEHSEQQVESGHKNCRPVLCRRAGETTTVRYVVGARHLRLVEHDGIVRQL